MDTVQFAPIGQSKQVFKLVLVLVDPICPLLRKIVDICVDPLLRVYVPCAQGMHRQVSSFWIYFTLAFVQLMNNDKML